ncbi:SusC/RagA family TonB-linked outer membrane protein [Flavobacterium algicola]|uniref:SusC/RagA family TonB-linked outer membrane protein n=1 Tax=Flavobacterium algicola TaxID=556529 RepID=UPI001EFC5918|nr:SusC/RagA family TonB-linked outer membrane protein [Flavobacterium algicola]MCG9793119.1 SusC/RagA family TonB-linked outer membrane protein [Flavobacterium algicola]
MKIKQNTTSLPFDKRLPIALLNTFVFLCFTNAFGLPTDIIENKNTVAYVGVQQLRVSGVIKDSKGLTLPGANIIEKGTTNGVQTDIDGKFTINVSKPNAVLIVSYIGFKSKEVPVGNQSTVNITLTENQSQDLDEVIIVGYGKTSTKKLTSSVSQITNKELGLSDRPVTNLQSALVGALPGLNGFNSSGSPGSSPTLSIRGNSTLSSGGVLVIVDGFEGSVSDLDPSTVQSVSVLKDASAVAIYGARGANGVLLITTKDTKRNSKLAVNFNSSFSLQTPSTLPTTLNSSQLMNFTNVASPGTYTQENLDLAASGFYPDTNWADELYKNSATQYSNSLSITGGSENSSYLLSASSLSQEGLVIGADQFKRLNLRFKLDTDINSWLTVGTNTLISNKLTNSTPAIGGSDLQGLPFYPVKTADGLWAYKGSSGQANAVAYGDSGSFAENDNDYLNLQLYAKAKLAKGLTFEERISYTKQKYNTRDWTNVYDYVTLDFADPDSYTNPDSANRSYTVGSEDSRQLTLTSYSKYTLKTFSSLNYELKKGNHSFDAMVAFQSEEGEAESFYASRTGFTFDNIIDLDLGQTNSTDNGGLGNGSFRGDNDRYLSYFGRINYDYKGKYLASFTFRNDGSSNFLEDRQYHTFPALSLGWNIGEENFLKESKVVDLLKLRASYGQSGDATGVGRAVTQLITYDVTGYPIGGTIAPRLYLGTPASRDLQWETSTVLNMGVDVNLWRGKFKMNADYFINQRDDILANVVTPTEYGFGNVPGNAYAVKSWGWELNLGHENNIGNVKYWLAGNLTSYNNEITDLAGNESISQAVGQSLNNRVGYVTDGFFSSQEDIDNYVTADNSTTISQSAVGGSYIGGFKYVDQNGDGVVNSDDRVILDSNSDTNLRLGFNLGLEYKNLSLTARFYGALDRNIFLNGTEAYQPFLNGSNAYSYHLDYYSDTNQNALFPTPTTSALQTYSASVSHLIQNAEFVKLQNVTLSYAFDRKTLDKIKFINGLSLSLSAENLGVIWTNSPLYKYGWDPEMATGSVSYPLPLTTSLSINVKF